MSTSSPCQCDNFYGIFIPNDSKLAEDNDVLHVYTDKIEALKLVKKYKKARFKAFKSQEEAEDFARHGLETTNKELSTEKSGIIAEKPSLFKAPKNQDLVQLRKAIEIGNLEMVKKTVFENPRFLISVGDTPSILQEGSRYNALHVAAKARREDICEFILDTISDPGFISKLYGDDDLLSCQIRAKILLDLYLNTPDKGLNETPLHFASKFGAVGVIAKLVSYNECDKHLKNKFGQTPKDIICSRTTPNPTDMKAIRTLLEEQFFVPVLSSEDNSLQPIVGEPFSPTNPPAVVQDVKNPTVVIRACAGPMPQEEANIFRKKWKTPPRSFMSPTNTPSKNDPGTPVSTTVRLVDAEKGLERIGRSLAHETNVGWKEFWPFLGTFTDLATCEGLALLEAYLKNRFLESVGKSFPNNEVVSLKKINSNGHVPQQTPIKKQPSCGKNAIPEKNCVVSPITDLCLALKACSLEDSRGDYRKERFDKVINKNSVNRQNSRLVDINTVRHSDELLNILANPEVNPFLYVERSCQVFSKRMADGLIHRCMASRNLQPEDLVLDTLRPEVKHLQRVISSYMDDANFVSVDFHLIHSRISSIVTAKLCVLSQDDIDLIISCLKRETQLSKAVDTLSSDEEDTGVACDQVPYRSRKIILKHGKKDILINQQVKCIANKILSALIHLSENDTKFEQKDKGIGSEEECMSVWSDASPCSCTLQNQTFIRRSRTGASFKRSCVGSDMKNEQEMSRRLDFTSACAEDNKSTITSCSTYEVESKITEDSDDEIFYTPPDSPDESDEDFMEISDGEDVYIEGNVPGKMDLDVLHALAGVEISPELYPNICRWRHLVLLHPEKERDLWASPAFTRHLKRMNTPGTLPPKSGCDRFETYSPEAWHRRLLRSTHVSRRVDFTKLT